MQGDGNLVLYKAGTALWSSETSGDAGAYAVMQGDGNLVVYQEGVAEWNSNTEGFPGAYLQVQDDSNAVIYQSGHPVWDRISGYIGNELNQWTLEPGAYLLSPDHQYELIMQGDGNLVLYKAGTALWSSETSGDAGAYAVMQGDGNLVVYQEGVAEWNSNTEGFPGAYLQVQDDSNAVIYQSGHPVWDRISGYIGNELNQWTLEPGAYLLSPDHQYELIMQGEGNLVLYHEGKALWDSSTWGNPGAYAVMQADGNFVIYNGGPALWSSGTSGYPGAYLVLQDDSNLVIYQGSTALWDWESGRIGGGGGGSAIVNAAESQDQYGAGVADSPANSGCNPYTAYFGDGSGGCAAGLRKNEWCADFAAWVWRQAGVSFVYGFSGSDINAWSASFYFWGLATGNWHPLSSGYSPQPGDVAVYGNLTEEPGPGHVGIYVGGSASSPTVVNGNWATNWPDPTNYGVMIQSDESDTGVAGGGLDGYVSP